MGAADLNTTAFERDLSALNLGLAFLMDIQSHTALENGDLAFCKGRIKQGSRVPAVPGSRQSHRSYPGVGFVVAVLF
jgi:hypothetical protein